MRPAGSRRGVSGSIRLKRTSLCKHGRTTGSDSFSKQWPVELNCFGKQSTSQDPEAKALPAWNSTAWPKKFSVSIQPPHFFRRLFRRKIITLTLSKVCSASFLTNQHESSWHDAESTNTTQILHDTILFIHQGLRWPSVEESEFVPRI